MSIATPATRTLKTKMLPSNTYQKEKLHHLCTDALSIIAK